MRLIALCTSILLSFICLAGLAEAAPVLSDVTGTDARLDEVTQLLDNQKTNADYWEYGWGAFNGGTMLWSAAQATGESDHRARNTDIVQASESLIGLADVVFRPLPAFHADSICQGYDETEEEKLKCLAAKERLLESSAERAEDPYTLLPHLGNAGFNLLAGLIISRVGGTNRALITAIPGEIIGEIQIWTIPRQPIADFDQYRIHISPLLAETGHIQHPVTGVMLSLRF